MDVRLKSAAYCRVSTLLGQTVDNQLIPIREHAERRGFDLTPERTYCDEGQSGAKVKRPALDRMMRDARAGKFQVLVVARLDRLARSVTHCIQTLDELHSLGITFVSLYEGFDASTIYGAFTMKILACVAEMELELCKARSREGIAGRKAIALATGKSWVHGRPSVMTGEVVTEVMDHHARGLSGRAIVAALNKRVSRATVERIIKSNKERLADCLKNGVKFDAKNAVISGAENGLVTASKMNFFEPDQVSVEGAV